MRDGLRRGARECGDTEGFPREVAKTTLQERLFIVKLVRQFGRTCPQERKPTQRSRSTPQFFQSASLFSHEEMQERTTEQVVEMTPLFEGLPFQKQTSTTSAVEHVRCPRALPTRCHKSAFKCAGRWQVKTGNATS